MSRDGRDTPSPDVERAEAGRAPGLDRGRAEGPYDPGHALELPRGDAREPVTVQHHTYYLRGSEAQALATIGAFRVVAARDVQDPTPRGDVWHGGLQHLWEQGLIERTRVAVDGHVTDVVALTRARSPERRAVTITTDARAHRIASRAESGTGLCDRRHRAARVAMADRERDSRVDRRATA